MEARSFYFAPPPIHLPFSETTLSFLWGIWMHFRFTMDEFPRDNALGSFEDLLQRLEDLNHDSPREPFGGMAFEVSPTQYLTLLQAEPRGDPDTSDYSCGVVYYKKKSTQIHLDLSDLFSDLIMNQTQEKWAGHDALPPSLAPVTLEAPRLGTTRTLLPSIWLPTWLFVPGCSDGRDAVARSWSLKLPMPIVSLGNNWRPGIRNISKRIISR